MEMLLLIHTVHVMVLFVGAGGVNVPGVMDARLTKSMIIQLNVGIF